MIAEGLPILLKSADELLTASERIEDHPRSAAILIGQSTEELSKILILMDIVRCPPKARGALVGRMFDWFYGHLPRLLYAQAQSWRPVTVDQLQEYLDDNRKSHDIDGFAGEYIMPNTMIFARENRLYADIVAYESGEPEWSEPSVWMPAMAWGGRTQIWRVAKALNDLGAFSRKGLDIVSDVWGTTDFVGSLQCLPNIRTLTQKMVAALIEAELPNKDAQQQQVDLLYEHWQIPMYRLNFAPIQVSLEELKAAQERAYEREVGEYNGY